jgi:hypothetical protein
VQWKKSLISETKNSKILNLYMTEEIVNYKADALIEMNLLISEAKQ